MLNVNNSSERILHKRRTADGTNAKCQLHRAISGNVGVRWQSGKPLLALNSSQFDPNPKSRNVRYHGVSEGNRSRLNSATEKRTSLTGD